MKIPELLVEYLIIGSFALFWLIPSLMLMGIISDVEELSHISFALFVPAVHVLGMLINSIANTILKRKKYCIKELILKMCKMMNHTKLDF